MYRLVITTILIHIPVIKTCIKIKYLYIIDDQQKILFYQNYPKICSRKLWSPTILKFKAIIF